MGYERQNFKDGETVLMAKHLINIEDAIEELFELVEEREAAGGENTITFFVDGVAYTAVSGMTWKQWIASDYNPQVELGMEDFGSIIYEGKLFAYHSDQYPTIYKTDLIDWGEGAEVYIGVVLVPSDVYDEGDYDERLDSNNWAKASNVITDGIEYTTMWQD